MPDIFDEVEEEVRAERLQRFLTRYGWLLLAGAVLVIVAVGGWRVREWQLARADQAAALQYMRASTEAQAAGEAGAKARADALQTFARLAQTAPEGYRTLSRLRAAALLDQSGKGAEAMEMYSRIAADGSADPLLRDLATLQWAEHQIDTGDPQLLEARLKPLALPDSPWRPIAERELALLDLRQNRPDAARTLLRRLAADQTAPQGVRDSAALMLERLGS